MRVPSSRRWLPLAALPVLAALLVPVALPAQAQPSEPSVPAGLPDPLDRGGYEPATGATTQDFVIALRDTEGREAMVHAGDERWGNALHMSTGTETRRAHIVLDQIRVPLTEFAKQGVDVSSLDAVEFRFGEVGTPESGSIQLADVRFQEAEAQKPLILSDGTALDQGAGYGPPRSGPDPVDFLDSYDNRPGAVQLNDTVGDPYSNTAWVVDDDKAQCPNASFTSIQTAVDFAAPWDTIVVCEGVYEESSTPINGSGSPSGDGSMNGMTIAKPLKIKGAGAGKVTITPDQSLETLAGTTPYLRDGGGNVITVSRQSLGSTDTNEMFVEISGVTVTSGSVYAEAGIAFFGAAGRVSESVVGPLKVASTPEELAANPHGWGIVKTGLILGAGPATVESEVTVANSVVTGYQSGGILFDGARGTDGDADNVVRTGIIQNGYVTGTVVEGTPNSLYPQTGVKYTSGTTGSVKRSRITGNYFEPDPTQSAGILLTDAGTEVPGGLYGEGDILSGNGFAAYNANADNTAVRERAPFTVARSYLGDAPVSATDTTGAATVTTPQLARKPLTNVPSRAGSVVDEAPTAALIDPADLTEVRAGETIYPLVRAADDFAVESVTLLVNGQPVGTSTTSPYALSWTPSTQDEGDKVSLQAIVADSSGQQSRTHELTIKVAR